MKHLFPTVFLLLAVNLSLSGQPSQINPAQRHESAFAIIIDQISFKKANEAVMAYKNVLEQDGLSVYILHDNWTDPTHVRGWLKNLYNQDTSLEGVVFIGDIPVPMIRQAQHMTTAFKMVEDQYPIQESSVASDRFYDDFDLQFEYLGQDEDQLLWHYYNLRPDSPQRINSDIYSGRIMPLRNGTDPYRQISDFLFKVVNDRKQQNQLEHLFSYYGNGSQSECMIARASENIALHQQFPHLSIPGNSLKYMSFNMGEEIKTHAMNELQREELDVALIHKHGSIDIQHLSGPMPLSNSREMVEAIKRIIYRLQKLDLTEEELLNRIRWSGITLDWVQNVVLPEGYEPVSKAREDYELNVHEILEMTPGARFVKLSACYNGSFHHDENVAAAYLFNDGNTIVTIGNTVNVLQDNWPNQFIGLLTEGVRLGHLRQHIHTLESHIIGDPTFRFAPRGELDLNRFIIRNRNNPMAWEQFLGSDNPDLIAYALRMISMANPPGFSGKLMQFYSSSPYYTVRMECLHLLRNINDNNYHQALKMSVNDSYELVRRLGAAWMEDAGLPEFIPHLVGMAVHDPLYLRASGHVARKALAIYPKEMVVPELTRQLNEQDNFFGRETLEKEILASLNTNWDRAEWIHLALCDESLDMEDRLNTIRSLRNNNYYHHTQEYIDFAKNGDLDDELRFLMIEALGWFEHAYTKNMIIEACQQIASNQENPEAIRSEAAKTIRRLQQVTIH